MGLNVRNERRLMLLISSEVLTRVSSEILANSDPITYYGQDRATVLNVQVPMERRRTTYEGEDRNNVTAVVDLLDFLMDDRNVNACLRPLTDLSVDVNTSIMATRN